MTAMTAQQDEAWEEAALRLRIAGLRGEVTQAALRAGWDGVGRSGTGLQIVKEKRRRVRRRRAGRGIRQILLVLRRPLV